MKPSPKRDTQTVASLVRAYLEADYRWTLDGDWHDLRIGLPAPGLELAFPHSTTFGFLSAYNPWSDERPAAENRAADDALHAALTQCGLPFIAAFASAPNRSWREPSWVVMGKRSDAFDTLSRQFQQLGTFWWQTGQPVRLRIDAPCPEGMEDNAHIDWLR